ncbi:MAG TPA: hypothetical protein VNG51_18630 [Ktedonobacteraceae bacterium]|nr:hypothetical protein [Ktedonobacteraceae bacterium]
MENQQPNQSGQSKQAEQPNAVTPAMRIPQVAPQFITTQRKVFIVPSVTAMSLPDKLPQTPMPGQPTQPGQQQRTFVTPSVTFLSLPQHIKQTPRPQFFSGKVPTYTPTESQQAMDFTLPQTPMPSANGISAGIYNISIPVQPGRFPDRPPLSIPGSRNNTEEDTEPGVGETLIGCGVLIVLAIVVLVALYYISM